MKMPSSRMCAVLVAFLVSIGSFSCADTDYPGKESSSEGPSPTDTGTTPRVVLAELFTNWGCPPCVYANPPLNRLGDEYPSSKLALLYFHMWWPSANDPFYLDNIPVMVDRRDYYSIPWVPRLIVDGTLEVDNTGDTTYDTFKAVIDGELDNTNLDIDIEGNITATQGRVTATITATDPVGESNLFARFYLWEDDKWAEGPNGEARHRYVVRESIPQEPLNIKQGDIVVLDRTFSIDPSWDKRRLGVVVFVQSDNDKRVLQAATLDFVPQGILLVHDNQNMALEVAFNESLTQNGIPYDMHNIAIGGDTYLVDMKDTPSLGKMSQYGGLLWHTSDVMWDTISPMDQANLQSYLNGYGNLYMTGENIGAELGNNFFYLNYLHATYTGDSGDSLIQGVLLDPISGNWAPPSTLPIAGSSPSIVNPYDLTTTTFFNYVPSSSSAAVKADHDSDSRVAYMAHMYFEGTARGTWERYALMQNIVNWLDNASSPFVDVLDPDGGEVLDPGQVYDIKWSAMDVVIPADGVSVYYTLDSTSPTWVQITMGEPNDGICTWTLPVTTTTKARVRVCVRDSMGNENCVMSDADFTIGTPGDTAPPTISNVLVDGQPTVIVSEGTAVALTAMVSDFFTGGSNVSGANYTIGFQNWPGTNMSAQDGGFDEVTENVNATVDTTGWLPGNYDLYVYGWDSVPNYNAISSEFARITIPAPDTTPPEIFNVAIDGSSGQTYYLSTKPPTVRLSADLDDSSTGNSRITGANYTATPAGWPGDAMDPLDGNFNSSIETAYYDVTTPGVGTYQYYVYAWDEIPNYNNTGPFASLTILDDVPPEILNVLIDGSPSTAIVEGAPSVLLTATIDDANSGGSAIQRANYTIGPQAWPGLDMNATDGTYDQPLEDVEATVDTSSLAPGSYDLCVYAVDGSTLQNENTTGDCAQLQVLPDAQPPEIGSVLIDGQFVRTVPFSTLPVICNITATIDDTATGGSSITGANYTTPTPTSWPGYEMNASDGVYDSPVEDVNATFYAPSAAGTYPYYVYAWDEKGNYNDSAPFAFLVVEDDVPPEISNVLVNGMASITVSQGTSLALTAMASDVTTGNSNIMGANYTNGFANWASSMSMDAADTSFDSAFEDLTASIDTSGWAEGTHRVFVYAVDSRGNGNITSIENVTITITIPDTQPPEILNAKVNGNTWIGIYEGDPVVLNATITDESTGNSMIGGANYTIGIQNWPGYDMNALDGDFNSSLEDVTVVIDTTGWSMMNHTICIYAWDIVPNENTTSTACVSIDILAVHPLAPLMTGADLTGPGLSNVQIRWDRSGDDGLGSDDVVEYDIYQATNYSGPYAYITSEPATNSPAYNWTCLGCGVGDPNSYFFYVEADNGVLTEPAPNKASKFLRFLGDAPQLISVPLILSSDDISFVLQTLQFDMAYYYDTSDASDPWKSYMPFKPYKGDLTTVDRTMALWVNVTSPGDFVVAGLVPETTAITLLAGWNLVGFSSFAADYTVADLKLDVNASNVEEPDPTALPFGLKDMLDTDAFLAGRGYWIEVPEDVVWTMVN
ncbi:MAG: hypothetical protein ACE5IJ_00300 [Thermoplasmata archaeon]